MREHAAGAKIKTNNYLIKQSLVTDLGMLYLTDEELANATYGFTAAQAILEKMFLLAESRLENRSGGGSRCL